MLIDDNPIKGIGQLLAYAQLGAAELEETIKLMDVPLNKWKIRKMAMLHAQKVGEQCRALLREHEEVCARLKELGY